MHCSTLEPEIDSRSSQAALGLTLVVHLLFLLIGIWAPTFLPHPQPLPVVQTVKLIDPMHCTCGMPDCPASPPPVAVQKSRPPAVPPIPTPSKQSRVITPPPAALPSASTALGAATAASGAPADLLSLQPEPEAGVSPTEQPGKGEMAEPIVGNLGGKSTAMRDSNPNPMAAAQVGESSEIAKKRYLAKLLAHIEAQKFYPVAARRRRLEGEVRVRFTLEANGRAADLEVSEGDSLLAQAAREAVERAQPLPLPQGLHITPLPVSYQMEFRLR